MKYKYCPECGEKLTEKEAGDDGMVPYCDQCNRFWFEVFSSCVIVMVVNEINEIALLRQAYLTTEYETFVSGYINPGETAEECAIREVKEEIGLDIERLEYSGTHWFAKREQLMHAFIGYVKKKDFHISKEVDAAEWVSLDDAFTRMSPYRTGSTQHYLYNKFKYNLRQ